jgi:hypothetical protein
MIHIKPKNIAAGEARRNIFEVNYLDTGEHYWGWSCHSTYSIIYSP